MKILAQYIFLYLHLLLFQNEDFHLWMIDFNAKNFSKPDVVGLRCSTELNCTSLTSSRTDHQNDRATAEQ